MMFPKPWQVGQAPNGLLNENRRGCGTSYWIPQSPHSNSSLNRCTVGSADAGCRPEPVEGFTAGSTSMAKAVPPPSR